MAEAPRVRDVMTTKLVTLCEEDNLEGVAQSMQDFHIRHLPVVDGDRLVGMVTQSDLLRLSMTALGATGVASSIQASIEQRTFVAQIMQRNPPTLTPDTSLAEAARLLLQTRAGALAVVDATGDLVGILSEIDVLRVAVDRL
ncbi:MAG: CBS domain-containing protein [Sandaracinaceae bacterium]|jgi:CBS domain-containing protein|nr:CBS domain-containing protein [Sandaracinaceae bacterium]